MGYYVIELSYTPLRICTKVVGIQTPIPVPEVDATFKPGWSKLLLHEGYRRSFLRIDFVL
jgi:hypothetical protein